MSSMSRLFRELELRSMEDNNITIRTLLKEIEKMNSEQKEQQTNKPLLDLGIKFL